MPSVLLDAVWFGVAPLLIVALLAASAPPLADQPINDQALRVNKVVMAAPSLVWNLPFSNMPFSPFDEGASESAHTHQETPEGPPPTNIEMAFTTSATRTPFFPNYDASSDVVRHAYATRDAAAAFRAATGISAGSPVFTMAPWIRKL